MYGLIICVKRTGDTGNEAILYVFTFFLSSVKTNIHETLLFSSLTRQFHRKQQIGNYMLKSLKLPQETECMDSNISPST